MIHFTEATLLATEEHRARNERYQRAERLGLFRKQAPRGPQLLTKLGNQLINWGITLQARANTQADHGKAALEGGMR